MTTQDLLHSINQAIYHLEAPYRRSSAMMDSQTMNALIFLREREAALEARFRAETMEYNRMAQLVNNQ